MTVPTRRRPVMGMARAAAFGAIAVAAASCGGGGAAAGVTPGGGAAATAAPSSAGAPSPGVGTVAISGRVVDDGTPISSPIQGAHVALAVFQTPGPASDPVSLAAPIATTVTASDGTWNVVTRPGSYLLTIASGDAYHAVLHARVDLTGSIGSLSISLLRLSSVEQSCLDAFNRDRVALGLSAVAIDEYAQMVAREAIMDMTTRNTDVPSFDGYARYSFLGGVGTPIGGNTGFGYPSCASWEDYTLSKTSPGFPYASSPVAQWVGLGFGLSGGGTSYSANGEYRYP